MLDSPSAILMNRERLGVDATRLVSCDGLGPRRAQGELGTGNTPSGGNTPTNSLLRSKRCIERLPDGVGIELVGQLVGVGVVVVDHQVGGIMAGDGR